MLENIFYVIAIIGFILIVVDSTVDFIEGFRKKKEDPDAWKKEINSLHGYVDNLEQRIMGKFEITDTSIVNLGTRTQELDEMIRWYAGELKEEELKDWTYIQPDGSVKISSLKEEIKREPETEDNDVLSTLWNTLCDAYEQRKQLSEIISQAEENIKNSEESQSE